MGIDHSSLTDQVEHFDELTADQISRAQKVVAGNAIDVQDAIMLLDMLGIREVARERDWGLVASTPRFN